MWHKAIWKEHPMKIELTHVGFLVEQKLKDILLWAKKKSSGPLKNVINKMG